MNSRSMAGWIGFAGILMVILGGLTFFEGLIALLRDNYYVVTPAGFLVFDITGWGWIMLLWGIVLACVGLALLGGASWARWTSILFVSVNVFGQLGFLGNTNDTAVAADHADVEHHRSLRADRPLGREHARSAARESLRTHQIAVPVRGPPQEMSSHRSLPRDHPGSGLLGPSHRIHPATDRRARRSRV